MKRIIALVLSLVLIASTLALTACGNKEPQKFETPEAHFEYVAEKAAKNYLSSGMAQYTRAVENYNSKTESASVKIELGDELTAMVGALINSLFSSPDGELLDLTGLKEIRIDSTATASDNLTDMFLGLLINGKEIAGADMQLNREKKTVFAKIPLISEDYFAFDMTSADEISDSFSSVMTMLEETDLKTALPTEEEITRIVLRYLELLLKKAQDGVESEEDFTVGSLTEKARCVTSVFTNKTVEDFVKEALTAMRTDADILAIIGRAAGEDKDDAIKSYQEEIDKALQNVNEREPSNTSVSVEIKFYTNTMNEILGVRVNTNSADDTGTASTATLTAGFLKSKDKYTCSVEAKTGDEVLAKVESEGEYSKGKITGVFNIKVGEQTLPVNVKDFTIDALEKGGNVSGQISIAFSDILTLVNSKNQGQSQSDPTTAMALAMLTSYSVVLDMSSTDTSSSISLGIKNETKTFFALSVSAESKKAAPVTEVTDAKTPEDFEKVLADPEVVSSMTEKLTTAFEEAGLDSSLIDFLLGLFL